MCISNEYNWVLHENVKLCTYFKIYDVYGQQERMIIVAIGERKMPKR